MSNVSKGNELEKKVRHILEATGFLVEKVIRTQWHRIDFFNRFDLIAVKDGCLRFIQVTTKENERARMMKVAGFPYGSWLVEVWAWDKIKKAWRIWNRVPTEQWVYSEAAE
jgi:hypothetical protein